MTRQRYYPAFGEALKRAMRSNGYTVNRLAAEIGYARHNLSDARSGYQMPSPTHLSTLVTLLDAPHLMVIARDYLRRTCDHCGAEFHQRQQRGPTQARFCGPDCRRRWHLSESRRKTKSTLPSRIRSATREVVHLKRRLDEADSENRRILAIAAANCWDCEPEGVCHMAECKMRELSPLPLAGERVA